MIETAELIRNFDPEVSQKYVQVIQENKKLFLTGEGSSRLFPAKHMIYQNSICNCGVEIFTEGASQALEYDLTDSAVFGVSNSGKTKELIKLLKQLKIKDHKALFGLTANQGTPVEALCQVSSLLNCGQEKAVAATKSVVEQSLFYHSLYLNLLGEKMEGLNEFADMVQSTLAITLDASLIQKLVEAPVIYFAGRNNGVAEEIALKTNEIAHKPSAYLEGTYAVHGIEEALNKKDIILIFDPFIDEEEKFKEVLVDGIGIEVIAISSRPTKFTNIQIPDAGVYRNYIELVMGWSILVEIGIQLGLDLDKPEHARKIGNEYE
ncbi:MAG: SIS domain-containing protein [Peptostreptococcaceae bacterium]|nr:SIS domain-containing protein [Peptostreptococcaceae bacterium]